MSVAEALESGSVLASEIGGVKRARKASKTGAKKWRLTEKQQAFFWQLWRQACAAQNWGAEVREERRREVLARCGFASATEITPKEGFDRVKKELLTLCDNVRAAGETEADQEGRRLRWIIRSELLPCLGVYVGDAEAYLVKLMRDKERWFRRGLRPTVDISLDDLSNVPESTTVDGVLVESDSPLRQCLFTLSARLDALRSAAGDSQHDMRLRAGVPCRCQKCR